MVLDLHSHAVPLFITSLIANCGGILFTVCSVVSIVANATIDPLIRSILLSFSIANVVGTSLLSYDTIVLALYHDEGREESQVMTISVMLSLSHLILLMLAEYVFLLTSDVKRRASDFSGLIVTSWIISVTIGMINVVSREKTRIFFALMALLVVFHLAASYVMIVKKHKRIMLLQHRYQQNFLRKIKDGDGGGIRKNVNRCWQFKYFPIILISYAGCSILWIINELREGLQTDGEYSDLHSVVLIIYSMNFYV